MKKVRQSNIELLRIVLILMIIMLHYFNAGMGGALGHTISWSVNYYLVHLLESLCIVAVNAFILITGYFSYRKESIKVSKVVRLIIIMIFWGLILSLLTVFMLQPQKIGIRVLINIIQIATSQWFVVIYCILYLLIPFLNKIINSINQKSYKWLLGIDVFFFYFWASFSKVTLNDAGYGIVNFVCLYFIGAYIRKYHEEDKKIAQPLLIYLISALIVTIISFKVAHAWAYCFIFNLIGSIALFQIFRSINIRHSKIINKLATYTFAVYLIDVNGFFNIFLYRTLFHSDHFWNNNGMILNLIISVIGIYLICIVLETLRRLIFGRLFDWIVGKVKLKIEA